MVRGPAHRFGHKLQDVPAMEYHDVLAVGDTLWLAGDGLLELRDGQLSTRIAGERISALAHEATRRRLWFAGHGRVGCIRTGSDAVESVAVPADFIWSLVLHAGRLWYFGSAGYGWIDPDLLAAGGHWPAPFSPRPVVMDHAPGSARLLVSSGEGVWEIGDNGRRLVIPAAAVDARIVAWIEPDRDGYLLGTAEKLYRWSGREEDLPLSLESNYSGFFKRGISNSVGFHGSVAIAAYPLGIAYLDRHRAMVDSYLASDSWLSIGDVYKIRGGSDARMLALGSDGIAEVDVAVDSRFYPATDLWGNNELRSWTSSADKGYLFTKSHWIEIGDFGYRSGKTPHTADWVALAPEDRPVYGSINGYEEFKDDRWVLSHFERPVTELVWGSENAYAVGTEGIYLVSTNLGMRLIHPETRQLKLLGEHDGSLYFVRGDSAVSRLSRTDTGWRAEPVPLQLDHAVAAHAAGEAGVWIAAGEAVYLVNGAAVREFPCASGWVARGISAAGGRTVFLFENPLTRQMAAGEYRDGAMAMLSVPYLERLGDPVGIMGNAGRVGVIGAGGVGWYARNELEAVDIPVVDFDLLLENRRIEDRTIPSGMHFIDLQLNFRNPEIPCQVQYRINEQRWRTVNLQDPSLQFAGHGNFMVELRAVFPNGNASPARIIQFGIAPPWYLNPMYQGLLLLAGMLATWGLFHLRAVQLKRNNLWLQGEVKKRTRELEAISAARTNFLAGISHDIRNPLNGVLMIAETLSRNPPKDADDRRLKDLTEFGMTVDRMLGEILDLSAIDGKGIPITPMPASLPDIIQSTIKQNQFLIQKEGVRVDTRIDPGLGDAAILTDRGRMINLLSNLLINALEYSGSDRIEIGATCHEISATEVLLEAYVADWGKGIDPSEHEFVFERFYRGESGIESGTHGTGLGLSICREIAHAVGGHLRLEDNQPSGCRFILKGKFPRVEGSRELDRDAVLSTLAGKRVLVVDDLAYNRRAVVEFLETLGCRCDESESGRTALALLEQNAYHLALLDWDLPGLTGPEVARRHRKSKPADPVILIAVTAYTDNDKKRESGAAGMNGYISKPLTATRLAQCLSSIQDFKPTVERTADIVNASAIQEEIYKHVEDCLRHGQHREWEDLRRCAHRLTTLALIENNTAMQQVCRDIQVAASGKNNGEAQAGLLELQRWRRP